MGAVPSRWPLGLSQFPFWIFYAHLFSVANHLYICRVCVVPFEERTVTYREETQSFTVDTQLFTESTANNLNLSKTESGITHRQLPGQAARNSLPGFPNLLPNGGGDRKASSSVPPQGDLSLASDPFVNCQPAANTTKRDGASRCLLSPHQPPKASGSKRVPGAAPVHPQPQDTGARVTSCAIPTSAKFTCCPCLLDITQ